MLEHRSHSAVIVSDNDINDKEAIIEGMLYHLQNCRSLHTFRASLKVLWALMFFLNRFFVIDIIVSDDDSTMRAVLKHPSKGARGQVLKSSKGKLHEDIHEPYFLADPSHRVKVVAKHIFSIVNKIRDLQCGCTKADALRLKKDWGYMIKKNRGETIEELSEASKIPLKRMFNSHDNCSS